MRTAISYLMILVVLWLGGCPGPDPEIPLVGGTYPVIVAIVDGDCIAQDPYLPNDSFLTWMGGDGQWGTLTIAQQDSDLNVDFGECSFAGTVDAAESFYFGGDCATTGGADVVVTATGTVGPEEDDPNHPRIVGDVLIEVDYLDGAGAEAPDGTVDCSREVAIDGRAQ
jgi:hypothetical protein